MNRTASLIWMCTSFKVMKNYSLFIPNHIPVQPGDWWRHLIRSNWFSMLSSMSPHSQHTAGAEQEPELPRPFCQSHYTEITRDRELSREWERPLHSLLLTNIWPMTAAHTLIRLYKLFIKKKTVYISTNLTVMRNGRMWLTYGRTWRVTDIKRDRGGKQ